MFLGAGNRFPVRTGARKYENQRAPVKLAWGGVGQHLHKSRTGARFLAACANRMGRRGRRSKFVALPACHPRAAAERSLGNAVRGLAAPEKLKTLYFFFRHCRGLGES